MALRNQPYFPMYANDWISNIKLKMCCAESHGIMINIMCLMHKEDEYGKILLRQKFKQNDKQILNFATMLAMLLPFEFAEIERGLNELINEKVLIIEDDYLICERMVKDAYISLIRSESGEKGGNKTSKKNKKQPKNFATANKAANTENETIIETEVETISIIESDKKPIKTKINKPHPFKDSIYFTDKQKWRNDLPKDWSDAQKDYWWIKVEYWSKQKSKNKKIDWIDTARHWDMENPYQSNKSQTQQTKQDLKNLAMDDLKNEKNN
jgi:hypothetical protein